MDILFSQLKNDIKNISNFRVPKVVSSCFTQTLKQIVNLVYYKTWVYTPQKEQNT